MRDVLNLATRPSRNERLPALLFGLASAVLLVLTVQHALAIARLVPGRTSTLDREVASLEAEVARLGSEAAGLRVPRPDPKVVAQWALVKQLVDRRAFSWTRLLSRLETVLPADVRLTQITPSVKDGTTKIELEAVARSAEEGLALVRLLEDQKDFSDVYPLSARDAEQGAAFRYEMRYVPTADAGPAAAASPTPRAKPAEPADEEPAEGETPAAEGEAR